MATLELTEDQVLVLKAAWEYFMETDEGLDMMQEALEISNEERGLNEDGEEGKDYLVKDDPVAKRVDELGKLIMNL